MPMSYPDLSGPHPEREPQQGTVRLQPILDAFGMLQRFNARLHPENTMNPNIPAYAQIHTLNAAKIGSQITELGLPILNALERFPNPREEAVTEVRGIMARIKERAGTNTRAIGEELSLLVKDLLLNETPPEGRQKVDAPLLRSIIDIAAPNPKVSNLMLNPTILESVAPDILRALGTFIGDTSYAESINGKSGAARLVRGAAEVIRHKMMGALHDQLPPLMAAAREAIPTTQSETQALISLLTNVANTFGMNTPQP